VFVLGGGEAYKSTNGVGLLSSLYWGRTMIGEVGVTNLIETI